MYERCVFVKRFLLPPNHCTSKTKHIDAGKVCCEQQGPHEFSTPIGIHSGHTAHKKTWVDPGHVGIVCCESQAETGGHSENKTDQVKPESSTIRVITGTPEV